MSNFPKPPRPEEKVTRYKGVVLNTIDTEESVWVEKTEGQEVSCTGYESSSSDFKNSSKG